MVIFFLHFTFKCVVNFNTTQNTCCPRVIVNIPHAQSLYEPRPTFLVLT